ncbi:MAG TPA: endolytic transglycosylase MltG [Vicinamibacterales bacterium]|nr:endolytic transglycosylase MltG [Vicinamibacterales bacterium]
MKIVKRLLLLAVLLALAAGAGAWVVYQRVQQPFRGFDGPEQFVEIAPGTGASTIGARLAEAGVVRDARTFRLALWLSGRGRDLKAGEYRFDREATPFEVIDRIARGDVYKRLITFREGLTIREMAQVFEERGFGAAAEFEQAAKNASLIADLDSEAADLEGYLFPETYALPRGTSAAELVTQMVGLFKRLYAEPLRAEAAAAGFSTRQIVTLASLVEKETARREERPLVAAVYRNRLKVGMGMQADPTVIFALQRAGRYDGNLSREDLQFDSHYNTYRYPGLPPGPIASPGLASLEAAVRPAAVSHLYFVSRNDGSHVFADTLAEHNRNVQQWQVEYFRERRHR